MPRHACHPGATDATIAIPEIDGGGVRCDQANRRGVAVAKRLRFTLIEIRDHSIDAPGQIGRFMLSLSKRPEDYVC